ncbi:hypothetical protein OsI_29170 [Oryza sativa Indica Group]|uniref:CCHC-type domain-containing protein n=1 Tax=Oryza sativa subsp. indica TaxID=39946 RepID=B8BAK0_ORYSI|nr:hypothetical protein OsI_29170 [Oryza sativa Indica Group]
MSPQKKLAVKKPLRVRTTGSPLLTDVSWVSEGMDGTSACRVAVELGPFVEFTDNGRPEFHVTKKINWVLDRDTICWIDLMSDLDVEIASDSALLHAFDMYWEQRRLPLVVEVSDDPQNRTEPCVEQGTIEAPGNPSTKRSTPKPKPKPVDTWGENDEVEYVGVADEKEKYKDLVSDDEEVDPDYEPDSDEDDDDLAVGDEEECESVAHITDVENPNIDVDFPTLTRGGTEHIARLRGASGGFMRHDYRMAEHGRQMIMERISVRKRLADKLTGQILPSVMKAIYAKSKNLGYKLYSAHSHTGEIGGTCRDLKTWRHTLDLIAQECNCKKWQLTGIPSTHAIFLIVSWRGLELEKFVSDYYSVATFKRAYAGFVVPMTDNSQWQKVNVGFKLYPPILKRSAGRPRSRRLKGVEEVCSGKRKHRCKRCGQFGHIMKTCNEPVDDPSAPPPAPPKPKRKRVKKVVVNPITNPTTNQFGAALGTQASEVNQSSPITRSSAKALNMHAADTGEVTQSSPNTRSRARSLNLDVPETSEVTESSPIKRSKARSLSMEVAGPSTRSQTTRGKNAK